MGSTELYDSDCTPDNEDAADSYAELVQSSRERRTGRDDLGRTLKGMAHRMGEQQREPNTIESQRPEGVNQLRCPS